MWTSLKRRSRLSAGVGHAAALSSGTAALHLAVKLAGVGRDDVVLCSDLTFAATVNPVSYENGIQVFVDDSEEETWNMDPEALELAFRKYPQAKAVIVANLYGTPAKLDEIAAVCTWHGVPLIEDAAEVAGRTLQGQADGELRQLRHIQLQRQQDHHNFRRRYARFQRWGSR